MADENQAIVPSEPAQPTIADQQPVEEPKVVDEPVDPGAVEQPTEPVELDDDFEDFEWDGKPIRGPKGLKDGVLRQSDYTKKTQEVAARAKDLESREAEINQRREATEAELDARAGLRTVKAELDRFKEYDYAAYQQHHRQDPMAANEAWTYKQDLANQQALLEATIAEAQKERTAKAQQETAKRWQETAAYAKEKIPGWSKETADKVFAYAEKAGVPPAFIEQNMSPVFLTIMHHAFIGAETLTAPTVKAPAVPPQPLRVVAAKSSPTNRTDLASADMEAYVAARRRGVGGKANF